MLNIRRRQTVLAAAGRIGEVIARKSVSGLLLRLMILVLGVQLVTLFGFRAQEYGQIIMNICAGINSLLMIGVVGVSFWELSRCVKGREGEGEGGSGNGNGNGGMGSENGQ